MSLTKASYSMITGAPVNVKDFGAVGDGVTDDSAAFQAAVATLTSAGGKMIFVPKGVYVTSFELGYGQQIVGESARGSTLLKPPTGATYVITVKATVSARQNCQIRNMTIYNPGAVANCDGIYFNSASVSNINDSHLVENVFISDFRYGIYVTGRQILCRYLGVEIYTCTKGMYVVSDASNYAYNLNYFESCRFVSCTQEGVRITGYNIANKFVNCNVEQNNSSAVAGTAGFYIEDAEGLFLDNPYFESNGSAVVVDTVNPLSNSIGLYLTGARCFNVRVTNGWMVQSGTLIAVNVSSGIIGGEISGIRFAPNSGGFDVYVGDKLNGINGQPIIIDSNNYFSGQTSIKTDGAGRTAGAIRQTAATQYIAAATTLDLRAANKFSVSNATGFNLVNITNRFPGMTMMVSNIGAGTVTIDASLMSSGAASSLAANVSKQYLVLGFGSIGKFVEI